MPTGKPLSISRRYITAEARGLGEGGLARVEQRLIQLAERLDRHEHLAPDLEHGRVPGTGEPGRDRRDGPDVRHDVFAGVPVSPGGRLDQCAVPVDNPLGQQLAGRKRGRWPDRR